MAVYFEHAPGCFVFVGSANAEKGLDQPHHSPRFDFDEDALAIGCEFLLQAAEEALKAWPARPRREQEQPGSA
jgi:amidohydrolase